MSADALRQAAALMRNRARAADGGPWRWAEQSHDEWVGIQDDFSALGLMYAPGNAFHVASWHPAVALAVADWLDQLHRFITDFSVYDEDEELTAALASGDTSDWPEVHAALAVAAAYLGTAAKETP